MHELSSIVPMLCVADARAAHDYYIRAFGAVLEEVWLNEAGGIGDSVMKLGKTRFFVADESPENGALSPKTLGGSSVMLLIKSPDADALFAQATAAGATVTRPLPEEGGFRVGTLRDPFGHRWMIMAA